MTSLRTWHRGATKIRVTKGRRDDGVTHERVDGWVDGHVGRWMHGQMDEHIGGWMDGWMDGQVDGWMDGWMDR
jgi:hypothetical protein